MKENEKAKYSIWENVSFMLAVAWESQKRVLFIGLAVTGVSLALNLVQLFIAPEILAQVEKEASIQELFLTIGLFTGALFLFQALNAYLSTIRMPGEIDVRTAIIRKLTRKNLDTSYPNIHDPKMLKLEAQAKRATQGNSDPAEHVWRTLTDLLTNVLGFLVYLFLLSDVHFLLLLLVVGTATGGFFISHYIYEWEYRHKEEREAYDKEISYFLQKPREIQLAKEIRVFGLAPWLRELRMKSMKALSAFLGRREKTYLWANVVDVVLTFLRNGTIYAYLIKQTLDLGWPASRFLLLFSAVGGFTTWVTGILTQFSQLHKESLALSRIQEYLHIPEPFSFEEGLPLPLAHDYELAFEEVSFSYPGSEKKILDHVNLTIHPGERLALVGLNGAGKTTMVMLFCGFYDPTEGRVLLNGQDIRAYNRRDYYALISGVFQDFSVLDTTIAECVAQTADFDRVKVLRCLDQAGLTKTIEKLPKGIDTHLGREVYLDGIVLSGGQTQRLMLARALYKDGPILVLDEPTAALDPLAESEIYRKYKGMTAGKTSLFISHRLASTRFCDRILFIADGGILEEGKHEDLVAKEGPYADLFEVQSRYYQEGGEKNGK
ncbi:ABC transporter ATP-binding protein [Kallipyga gabonensis]|uniref:ABC transporter ATP-binding protein n=1 Tax=Kallipyga gabonensis TaxID=1686287 RepID=UPI0006B5247B|nr:ABC transporter ATP-binding protein [Kallipyga gabonensis]